MSLSFLHLPREIRDIIYDAVLTSPTAHLLITIHKTPPQPGHPSSNGIRFEPYEPKTHKRLRSEAPTPYAALQRTTHQIRAETENWVWRYNTIVFRSPSALISIFKHMGQGPSRHIQRVRLYVNETWSTFDNRHIIKALSMLASRTRKGELRDVGLVLDLSRRSEQLPKLLEDREGEGLYRRCLANLLGALQKGAGIGWERGKVQRSFEVLCEVDPGDSAMLFLACTHTAQLATKAQAAWGGKILCNGELMWDNCAQVQRVSAMLMKKMKAQPD